MAKVRFVAFGVVYEVEQAMLTAHSNVCYIPRNEEGFAVLRVNKVSVAKSSKKPVEAQVEFLRVVSTRLQNTLLVEPAQAGLDNREQISA